MKLEPRRMIIGMGCSDTSVLGLLYLCSSVRLGCGWLAIKARFNAQRRYAAMLS